MAESKITNALNEGMQIPRPKCLEPMNMDSLALSALPVRLFER